MKSPTIGKVIDQIRLAQLTLYSSFVRSKELEKIHQEISKIVDRLVAYQNSK